MPGAFWTLDEIRNELEALQGSASYQKTNFYRDFTRRLLELLGDFKVVKGDNTVRSVEIIFANPERAVAKIQEDKNIVLPILSLQFEGIDIDNNRRKPMEAIVEKKFWDSENQRAVRYMALAPVATNIVFKINIWAKYIEEINQLTEQIVLKFRPNLPVDIRKGESYQAFLIDVSEYSNLEVVDRVDRIVKRAIRFGVESYIPDKVFRFTNTGELKSLNFETYIEETSGLQPLESFYAGGGYEFALNSIPNRGAGITTISST